MLSLDRLHGAVAGALLLTLGSFVFAAADVRSAPVYTEKIAFTSFVGGMPPDIYVMDADGTNVQQLTDNEYVWDQMPTLAPDGRSIVFASDRDGDYEIYKMGVDGSLPTQLTFNTEADQQPSFAEDGRSIVFNRQDGNQESDLWTMAADGSNQTQVGPDTSSQFDGALSPDGSRLAWSQYTTYADVFVGDADGTNARNLTTDGARDDANATWSPDGTRIAYSSVPAGAFTFDVLTRDPDGGAPIRLTTHSDNDYQPDYSSDGGRIAFVSERAGTPKIHTMRTDGTDVRRVSSNTMSEFEPSYGRVVTGESDATLSVADATVTEGDAGTTTAAFAVTLSEPAAAPVEVAYKTTDGSATHPADYTAADGRLTLAAGASSGTIEIPVSADVIDEPDETFALDVTASGADVEDGTATGTVADDDAAPSLMISDESLAEGDGGATSNMTFQVKLSGVSGRTVDVDWATADDGATAPGDYAPSSGTVTFVPGEVLKNVTVPVQGDNADEPDERFTVGLSGERNATLADGIATGTILDDDDAPPPPVDPSLRIDDVTVVEGDRGTAEAVFTVTLSDVSDQPVRADFATADGTASERSDHGERPDFTPRSGTLVFSPGTVTRTVRVPVVGDQRKEADETYGVHLRDVVNATVGRGSGTGTIVDDDCEARRASVNCRG